MNKQIKIDHIGKSQGHMGFVAHIARGDVQSARVEINEGARLIEGLLIGRQYDEAPIITSRICGMCPIVHNICSIKAIENALGIKVSQQTKLLRTLLLYAQIIQSHTLHLFIISENPKILLIREFNNRFLEITAGRTLHPLTTAIGGFRQWPKINKLQKLMQNHKQIVKISQELIPQFKEQPDFERKTVYRALKNIYGDEKINLPEEGQDEQDKVVKRSNKTFMLGPIARLHIYEYESETIDLKAPCYNPFYNIYAQAIEVAHYLKKLKQLLPPEFKKEVLTSAKIKAGRGLAACEAPRGTLYHSYEINNQGEIIKANIIPPTSQFLNNLESDLKEYLKENWDPQKAKDLIRAYDPCVSCAVH